MLLPSGVHQNLHGTITVGSPFASKLDSPLLMGRRSRLLNYWMMNLLSAGSLVDNVRYIITVGPWLVKYLVRKIDVKLYLFDERLK